MDLLKNDPFSRRIFLSAWNSADLDKTCLPPCHISIQFFVEEIDNMKHLSGHMYQRSADWFLGEPFNILSYRFIMISKFPPYVIEKSGVPYLFSKLFGEDMSGIAMYPFIFLKKTKLEDPDIYYHELIHIEQFKETLGLGFYVIFVCDFVYSLIKYRNLSKAYRSLLSEKEAYAHMYDREYLVSGRRRYKWLFPKKNK